MFGAQRHVSELEHLVELRQSKFQPSFCAQSSFLLWGTLQT